MFVPCTGTEDCGEESICGDAPNYGECGQDGICVCANKDNNYDGITAVRENFDRIEYLPAAEIHF